MYSTCDHGGYSIKNLKMFQTDDGYAFSLSLFLNGKKIGTVQNSGNGGPNNYKLDKDSYPALVKHAKTVCGESVEVEDLFIENLINDKDNETRLKRLCKTKVLVRFKGDKEGHYRTMKAVYSPDVRANIIAAAKKKCTEVIEILNDSF